MFSLGIRERVTGEITPVSAEQSGALNEEDEDENGAGLAIDLDLGTANLANFGTDTPSPWLKLTLDKVHCIQDVIMFYFDGNPLITWTCSDTECGEKFYVQIIAGAKSSSEFMIFRRN